jgi:hypothetical protein
MPLTLLVEKNPYLTEIYRLNLSVYVGVELKIAGSLPEAQALMAQHPFQLVISRVRMNGEKIAAKLTELAGHTPVFTIPHALDLKAIIKGCARELGVTAQQMAEKKVDDLYALEAHYFQWMSFTPSPLYTASGEQLCAGHSLPAPDLWKKHEHICVSKLDRLQMVNHITAEMIARLDAFELGGDEAITADASNHHLLSKKLLGVGITEETVALAQKNMLNLKRQVKSAPKLGPLLQRMLSNEASYLYRHTQVLTYVALHIVRHIDWGGPEQEEKTLFIALFHDIALSNDEEAQIHTKEQLRKTKLEPKSKALVEKHAQLAAELVQRYPHAPMGADQIIRQHHGVLNGVGFSDHFGANLSPMAIVFIVAEELTRLILQQEITPIDGAVLIRELRETFPTSRFQKIIDILERLQI